MAEEVGGPPPNPKHGEPGHDCPLDRWFEYRLQGRDVALLVHVLEQFQDELKEHIIEAALVGTASPRTLERAIELGEMMEELTKRVDQPLVEEYRELKRNWMQWQEHNV